MKHLLFAAFLLLPATGFCWDDIESGDAWSETRGKLNTLGTDLDTHEADTTNPHSVTAAQAGAAPYVEQSDPSSITAGFALDTDDGTLWYWDGDSVEEITSQTDDQTASEVPITDSGGYYAATEVESALQEIASDVDGLTAADVGALPTSGGTLTGGLEQTGTMPYLRLIETDSSGNNYRVINDTGGLYIQQETDDLQSRTSPVRIYPDQSDYVLVLRNNNALIGTTTDTGEKLQVNGGVKADSFTSAGSDGDNTLEITNNTSKAPTASAMELYPEGNTWKVNENGTEWNVAKANSNLHFFTADDCSTVTGMTTGDLCFEY